MLLHLANIKTTAVSSCSYPPGSISCKAWNHTNMDCSWRELDCIPQLRHRKSLELLDLSHNNLNVLPDGVFSDFIKLQTLDLSNNRISAINGSTFIGLNLLQSLDMSDTLLRSLPDGVFSGLPNLLSLDLSHSEYVSFPPVNVNNRTFYGLSKLKTLDLTWFSIDEYESPFQYLYSLRSLFLSSTDIVILTITPATFAGLHNTLQVLDICIGTIASDSPFVHLSSLQRLDLYITDCNLINEKLFIGLDKLSHLQLVSWFSHAFIMLVHSLHSHILLTRRIYTCSYRLQTH